MNHLPDNPIDALSTKGEKKKAIAFVLGSTLAALFLAVFVIKVASESSIEEDPEAEVSEDSRASNSEGWKKIKPQSIRGLYRVIASENPGFLKEFIYFTFDGNIYTLEKGQVRYYTAYNGNTVYISEAHAKERTIKTEFFTIEATNNRERVLFDRLFKFDRLAETIAREINQAGVEVEVRLDAEQLTITDRYLQQLESLAREPVVLAKIVLRNKCSKLVLTDSPASEITVDGNDLVFPGQLAAPTEAIGDHLLRTAPGAPERPGLEDRLIKL